MPLIQKCLLYFLCWIANIGRIIKIALTSLMEPGFLPLSTLIDQLFLVSLCDYLQRKFRPKPKPVIDNTKKIKADIHVVSYSKSSKQMTYRCISSKQRVQLRQSSSIVWSLNASNNRRLEIFASSTQAFHVSPRCHDHFSHCSRFLCWSYSEYALI